MGLVLASATAVGCVAYGHLCKSVSWLFIGLLTLVFFAPLGIYAILSSEGRSAFSADLSAVSSSRSLIVASVIYVITWATSPIWYYLTYRKGVMASSIYELKYVAILAVFYWLIGDRPFSANLAIGSALSVCSLFFISRA